MSNAVRYSLASVTVSSQVVLSPGSMSTRANVGFHGSWIFEVQAWIPIVPGTYSYSDTSAWVEKVSRAVGQMVPNLISWEWAKAARKGRARLDYTQNASIKTLVAPYAVRPAPGAPVSAPITWDELDDPDLRPNRWTIRNIIDRVAERGDLFAAAQTDLQELPKV